MYIIGEQYNLGVYVGVVDYCSEDRGKYLFEKDEKLLAINKDFINNTIYI